MKRYLLFSGSHCYPGGGWSDFRADFDTIPEARKSIRNCDWWQIVDAQTGKVIKFDEDISDPDALKKQWH